jgi:protein SCO1
MNNRLLSFILLLLLGVAVRAQESHPQNSTAANYFPNSVLLTQDNKPIHFYDDLLKDKTVVINFMFTSCMSICPAMTSTLARVQKLLVDHLDKDLVMISISVDPSTDTPERLKAYAAKYKVQPGWYFLTGEQASVDAVLKKLGGYVTDKNDHTSTLIIGNVKTGNWSKMYALSKPEDIVAQVTKIMSAKSQ